MLELYRKKWREKLYIDTSKLAIKALIELRKIDYQKWQPISCPLLDGDLVYFNKDGFYHLTHNGRGKIRNQSDQRMRLNLLPNAPVVIKRARGFGAMPRTIPAAENKYGKDILFYELVYQFNTKKAVTVVIRKIGNGQLHFYSVRFCKRKVSKKIA
ncbi:hypothetical protein IKG16_01680 [Candidatus Saccharibacteria bacterium]|nr:hypothetical protein [Candidatus Saccharibacteria bacterium]